MKNIKATPRKGAASQSNSVKHNTTCKLGAYERRCLKTIILAPVDRMDLDRAIGTTNAPMFISYLRNKGLSIRTERIATINRDGKSTWYGRYHLLSNSLEKAKQLLGD